MAKAPCPERPMDPDVALPIGAGLVLIVLIVVGAVVIVLRPSDLPDRRP